MTPTSDRGLDELGARYVARDPHLPEMPSDEIQRSYTGAAGDALMAQSVTFVRNMFNAYEQATGRPVAEADALDYGAGWGRLTRLVLPYVGTLKACDAWQQSVELFNSLGFPIACDKVDEAPISLPYPANAFDFVWLFSVLTHLTSERADAVMKALATVVRHDGLVAITVRPELFWAQNDSPDLIEEHRRVGYAYRELSPAWGHSSMSVEWMERWSEWQVIESEIHDVDPHQLVVYLRPR